MKIMEEHEKPLFLKIVSVQKKVCCGDFLSGELTILKK